MHYEPTAQIIVLIIIMAIIIIIVVMVYVLRWKLFGPRDLSVYGQLTTPTVSNCIVDNVTVQDSRCTNTGKQVEISYCQPNITTGYFCFDGKKQVINSQIRIFECTPTCTSFIWDNFIPTPCLINISSTPTTLTLVDPLVNWCNVPGTVNSRFKTYKCNTHDGSGPNACTFICGKGVDNADCTQPTNTQPSNSTTITYSPANAILEGNIPPPTQLVENNGTWTYTPTSSANVEFPTIPSNTMVTSEICSDLLGVTCGNWENPVQPVGNITTPNCVLFSNSTPNLTPIIPNTPEMLYEPGFFLSTMQCTDDNGSTIGTRCYPDSGNCIPASSVLSTIPTSDSSELLPDVCGVASFDINGHINGIITPQRDLSICVYADPDTSLTWSGRPIFYYNDPTDIYNQFKGIISVPLFVSNSTGYLSLYNTPCPNFTSTNTFGVITYNFPDGTDGFIDNKIAVPPPTGIPFRFDCKGNTTIQIQRTPAVWVPSSTFPPSTIWGLPIACDTPTGLINPVVEQSALILFIKPISITGSNLLCNIIGINSDNYVGWMTYGNSNSMPGYTWGQGNTIVPNKTILMWNQGRFDPFITSSIPGQKLASLGPVAQFILSVNGSSTPTNPLYDLKTSTSFPIMTIGTNNVGSNSITLSGLSFTVVTDNGTSLVKSVTPTDVELNGTLMSDLLYARSNRGSNPTPMCNLLITAD